MLYLHCELQMNYKQGMAEFNITTRKKLKDNTSTADVYISVAHNGTTRYIKTSYKVTKKGLKSIVNRIGKVKQEIKDPFVYRNCMAIIDCYNEKCNRIKGLNKLSCSEVVNILSSTSEEISFTNYAKHHINKMIADGREGSARNYAAALKSFSLFLNMEEIYFSEITSKNVKAWIESLNETSRAKNMYPTAIKALFKNGSDLYNDYDRDIIAIPNDPFRGIKIPRADITEKKALEANSIRKFFESNKLSKAKGKKYSESAEKMAYDVCKMIFYLAGINAADLYDMGKEALKDGKLCYNRRKTRDRRSDNSYIEIRIPKEILYLFKVYEGKQKLLYFSERYNTPNAFVKYIDYALKSICKKNKLEHITTYTFRHSWATIARNKCNVSLEDVAFCLNHVSSHKITDLYIDKDFSRIDKINRKVLDYVFKK